MKGKNKTTTTTKTATKAIAGVSSSGNRNPGTASKIHHPPYECY